MHTTLNIEFGPVRDLISELVRAFHGRGEEIFLVGGAVRDAMLGQPPRELDFATSAPPDVTLDIVQGAGLGSPYRVGEKFGTIGVAHTNGNLEITTYRHAERYLPGSRKPEVSLGGSLREDLLRRDFTVNAMAWDPGSHDVIDPSSGAGDLHDRILRAVGEPLSRFREDPLRLLRGVRFAAGLGLEIEAATFRAMQEGAPTLVQISRERIRDEYGKVLTGADAVRGLTLLRDAGLFENSIPELTELSRMPDHGPRHPLSLWDHVMGVVAGTPPSLVPRWAALLHDIAKPATRTHEPNGRPRFFHHEEVGAATARHILAGLRYPNAVVDQVALLIETHMQLHAYSPEWSDGAVRRLVVRLGDSIDDAIALARADAAAHSIAPTLPATSRRADALEERIASLGRVEIGRITSPLSGNDLMRRYGLPPGPWIGRIKSALENEVLDGNLAPNDIGGAWEVADAMVAEGRI